MALRAAWAIADDAQSAPPAIESAAWQRFDPAAVTNIPRGAAGAWVRLEAEHAWPQAELVLSVRTPPYGSIGLLSSDGRTLRRTSLMDPDLTNWHGHGRIALPLDAAALRAPYLLLHLEPPRRAADGMSFSVLTMAEFMHRDASWLAFASACLAVLVGMALMALCFGTLLRDPTFFFYAGYVLAYAMIQLVQTGYAAHPLGFDIIGTHPRVFGISALVFSVVFASLFVDRFVNLARHAPRLRVTILVVAALVFINSVFALMPMPVVQDVTRALINPLLIVAGPLLMIAGIVALVRGSRYAAYFLVGWTPLLVLTVLSSLQTMGMFADWTWLNDLCIAAAAFEAIVLSLGLADRALAMRRDRERIGHLAATDSLTGVFNRRAWNERAQSLLARCEREQGAFSVMFLDLDSFKLLNDTRGHEAGDEALLRLAELMHDVLRSADVIGRYGGEEFVVALPDCSGAAAIEIAGRLRHALEREAITIGVDRRVLTTCIGVAERLDGETLGALVARADAAMYVAKSAGRNRVVAAEPLRMAARA